MEIKSLQTLKDEIRTVSGYKVLIGSGILFILITLAIIAPFITWHSPTQDSVGGLLEEPSSDHIFGTSYMGYDVYSRTIYGLRTAFYVVLVATALAMSIGVPWGLFSGYFGGKLDRASVLFSDAMYSFPGILMALIIVVVLKGMIRMYELDISAGIYATAGAVAVVYIPQYFRVIRNHVMSVKEEVFVKAAHAIGSPGRDTILKYILPNVSQSIPVILTLNAADGVLTLAGLSFLGLGIEPPTPSLGYDLKTATPYLSLAETYPQIWYWSLIPGITILLIIIGFTLLGEGLNDILNPQLREGKRR